jgi:Fe-S-cluster-containing dehydrogenase component
MPKFGILVNYEFCTGCHACEIACQKEHHRPEGEYGIYVKAVEPEKTGGKSYYLPFPTDNCNLCGKRIARGLKPACVHSCWTNVMKFGTIGELAVEMQNKPGTVIWAPH